MELTSFKELLLKKAEGNPHLETLIKYAKDELIAEEIIASLIKMAEPSPALGRNANKAVTTYAGQLGPSDVEQLRDALGHHISRHKAALKAAHAATDQKTKEKYEDTANKHLEKIIPMMHLAGKAGQHSGIDNPNNKMALDYQSTVPWETNYTGTARYPTTGKAEYHYPDYEMSDPKDPTKKRKFSGRGYTTGQPGKLLEGTKDLARRPKSTPGEHNRHAVGNYKYLEMPPHPKHSMTENMPHKGGYPFEEIQLGHPSKVGAKQAYLPIENLDPKEVEQFKEHPFDVHPVHKLFERKPADISPESIEKFSEDLKNWKQGEKHKEWMESQKAKFQQNPEEYKKRGTQKPPHHYEGIPLRPQTNYHGIPVGEGEAVSNQVAPIAETPQAQLVAPKDQASTPVNLPQELRDRYKK